ncbi:LPXTG cell wall anchor domain-containing protein, partial [Saccharibacillus sp. JS10]|uniref:LPXTG cell wall anchor domain-containing protein n=1 Tax=Saccharibacillus sp. JS10 TaxID=2950552 RepID=UPI00210EEB2E
TPTTPNPGTGSNNGGVTVDGEVVGTVPGVIVAVGGTVPATPIVPTTEPSNTDEDNTVSNPVTAASTSDGEEIDELTPMTEVDRDGNQSPTVVAEPSVNTLGNMTTAMATTPATDMMMDNAMNESAAQEMNANAAMNWNGASELPQTGENGNDNLFVYAGLMLVASGMAIRFRRSR